MYVHISFIDAYNYRWLLSCILCGIVERDGVFARVRNPAVSSELRQEVYKWNIEGATIDDATECLRLRTVPSKYTGSIHSWTDGITIFTYIDTF